MRVHRRCIPSWGSSDSVDGPPGAASRGIAAGHLDDNLEQASVLSMRFFEQGKVRVGVFPDAK